MKDLFSQYDDTPAHNYGDVWKQALFVFDTNVLLNLYRYQTVAREELLNVLEELSERIWIPHHVALEFYRSRLKVIAEQNRRFADVSSAIEKVKGVLNSELERLQLRRRHSIINPLPLTEGFDKLKAEFLGALEPLRNAQQKPSANDPIKEKIEILFDKRVGPSPKDQATIDDLYKKGESRFKFKIPPGYMDKEEKGDVDEYMCGGIVFKRKYGDYLIWSQLLEHAKNTAEKVIIFITDDGKEDWWQKIDLDGQKTIGPRPELIDEAKRIGGVETMLMYAPDSFLKYAKKFLKTPVSEDTLSEIRDVSAVKATPAESMEPSDSELLSELISWRKRVAEGRVRMAALPADAANYNMALPLGREWHFAAVRLSEAMKEVERLETLLTRRASANDTHTGIGCPRCKQPTLGSGGALNVCGNCHYIDPYD